MSLFKINDFLIISLFPIRDVSAVLDGLLNCSYQINARTEIAVRYNDMSPLENHHCAMSFKILSQPECNIFANCSQDEFNEIRGVSLLIV